MLALLTRRPWIPALGAVAFLAAWTPTDNGPTLCPFALATGRACPGCGLTRAMAYLVRGDLDRAISYHPLAPLVATAALAGLVFLLLRRRRGWPPIPIPLINGALMLAGVALVGVWVLRMASGTLPPV